MFMFVYIYNNLSRPEGLVTNDESSAEITQEDASLRFVSSPSRANCEASSAGVCGADYTNRRLTLMAKQYVHFPINEDFQADVRVVVALTKLKDCKLLLQHVH